MSLLFNNVYSQNIENVVALGDSLFSLQKYDAALNEYRRAFFFSNHAIKSAIRNKIADCYLASGDITTAREQYDTAFYYAKNDSDRVEVAFSKIQCYLLQRNFGFALLKLNELDTDQSVYLASKKELLIGLSFFGLDLYDKAFEAFNTALDSADTVKIMQLTNLQGQLIKLKHPYPALATVMSILVPGSGQIYTGEILDGINSIVILAGLTCLSLYVPVFAVLAAPFLYRYYIGGILHANRYATDKRLINKSHFYKNLFAIYPETEFNASLFSSNNDGNHYHNYLENSDSEINILFSSFFIIYKRFFSSQDVDVCVFEPSCSVYMMEALKKEGLLLGFLDGLDRLLRCHSYVRNFDYPYNKSKGKYHDEL